MFIATSDPQSLARSHRCRRRARLGTTLVLASLLCATNIALADEPLPPPPSPQAPSPQGTTPPQTPTPQGTTPSQTPSPRRATPPGATPVLPPPPGARPYTYPPPVYPRTLDPVTAAYWREYEEEQAKKRKKKREEVPDFVKDLPEYKSAQSSMIGGVITLAVGGGATLVGAVWLISASLKGCGFFQSCTPDRTGQAGGAVMMGAGVVGVLVGGLVLGSARSEKQKIIDRHVPREDAKIQVHLGLGSVSASMAF